jgi:hypothetical protein
LLQIYFDIIEIPEEKRPEKQLTIGRRLLKGLTKNSIDQSVCSFSCNTFKTNYYSKLFDIVSLLNFGTALVTSPTEKIELARLNFSAGQRAKSTAAFGLALVYLQAADALLGKDSWKEDYSLTFRIFYSPSLVEQPIIFYNPQRSSWPCVNANF